MRLIGESRVSQTVRPLVLCPSGKYSALSKYDPQPMDRAIVNQRYSRRARLQGGAVELRKGDAAADARRIFDLDVIAGGTIPEDDSEPRPGLWYAWINVQRGPNDTQAQNALNAGALHPSRRTGVPCPSAAPDMRLRRVDIRRDNVGLDLIAMRIRRGACVIDRIEKRKQTGCLVALAQFRQSHDRPKRRMGVLAAILTNARRIPLDVTRIERRLVERRPEQQRDAIPDTDQFSLNCHHRSRGTFGIGRARDDCP